ncbi:FAD-dependent 5-carboxymethylaminomethyl-2-thiouridine(34) oxidoreductase MnmC [Burkholderiaceae bacterium FT117]|uniref:FAD-dependent 5-carboxymethylaminomethyl-2-thiouridine(34) oxidoreductase MnmC n=1 Tax=Zeimonas sediminis TaxID=2944268 RepID=UPI0023430DA3|nr:FAD-dependent 5-carboxymethylaminomethyl-2-thiouridine(34) oxidoreductase MnmC [Zeimonas sediminis]MCM5569321.1 FAD-dependent 5-carboxymethylaminomethyl-2-thiouridine(34) oxidoreductase MnmC [Zeimonas sediminis]
MSAPFSDEMPAPGAREGLAAGPLAADAFAPHPGLAFDESGSPFDPVYRDVFRSRAGAWTEAEGVFVDGCRLRERWRGAERFCVLELGFGLGVNFLATLAAWRADPARSRSLHFVSVEAHPLSREDLARGLAALSQAAPAADPVALLAGWPLALPGLHRLRFAGGAVTLTLAFGDAARIVPRLQVAADAFYLDGFAPSRNPAMWRPELMRALARLARPGARLATWSAAAPVREALAAAGFAVERVPGVGTKRHRIEATWAPRWRSWPPPEEPAPLARRHVAVIGAGLAGAATAAGFARRGFSVELLDARPSPGGEGSLQPLVADHLHLSPDDNPTARLTRAALLLRDARCVDGERGAGGSHAGRDDAARMRPIGRLVVDADARDAQRNAAMLARLGFPAGFARQVDRDQAADLAGVALPRGGLWLPGCSALSPAEAISAWLAGAGEAVRFRGGARVAALERDPADGEWLAKDASGRAIARAPLVVLANAGDAARLGALASLPLRRIRGQTTCLLDPRLAGLRAVLGGDAYAAPTGTPDGRVLVGASFDEGDSLLPDPRDDLGNLRRLGRMLELEPESMLAGATSAAVGFRYVLADRLPAIGALPDEAGARAMAHELLRNDRLPIPAAPGLYGAFGYGSRGLLWAALAAELLPALACGEPAPIERELIAAVAPSRLLRRRLRRALR